MLSGSFFKFTEEEEIYKPSALRNRILGPDLVSRFLVTFMSNCNNSD